MHRVSPFLATIAVCITLYRCGFDTSGVAVPDRAPIGRGSGTGTGTGSGSGGQIDECVADEVKCIDGEIWRCTEDGELEIDHSCGAPGCVNGADHCRDCEPNSAPRCVDNELVACSAEGEFETTSCDFGCQDDAVMCNACVPGIPPQCVGNIVETCDSNGVSVLQPCGILGCQNGRCCADADFDGVSDCAGDCDDHDANVFPGQTAYFLFPRSAGGYDYNCDGQATLQISSLLNCNADPCQTSQDGWVEYIPNCGQVGFRGRCHLSGGNQCLGPMLPDSTIARCR